MGQRITHEEIEGRLRVVIDELMFLAHQVNYTANLKPTLALVHALKTEAMSQLTGESFDSGIIGAEDEVD